MPAIATVIYFLRIIFNFISDFSGGLSTIETIIELQKKIANKINHNKTINPVPLTQIKIAKLIFVKFSNTIAEQFICDTLGEEYVLLGEIAQVPGNVAIANVKSGRVFFNINSKDLFMVPITEY